MSKTPEAQAREFTFPDSGKTIYYVPVSTAAIAMRLRRKYRQPHPPLQEVDYGNGHRVREHNYSHPEYKQQLLDYEEFIQRKAGDIALDKVLNVTLNKEQQAEVKAWKEAHPGEWDESDKDKDLWLEEIAFRTDGDFQALLDDVVGSGQPDEETVQAAADGFQGNVQGA